MDNNEPVHHPEEKPKNPTITIPPIQIHEKAPKSYTFIGLMLMF
jgi:hypothetical protein